MPALVEVLALLGAVPFRANPATLYTVLDGPAERLFGPAAGAAAAGATGAGAELGQAAGAAGAELALDPERFWVQLLPEGELQRVAAMLRAVAEDGVARVLEHEAQLAGRALSLRTAVQRVSASDGLTLAGVMLDVTAARAVERQAQEVESWAATLGESLPFDFWICDRHGRFVLQNAASRQRLGNLAGRATHELAQESEAHARWHHGVRRALHGENVREELSEALPLGGEADARIFTRIISPVRQEPEGAVTGALGVDVDVTELKRVEQRLRASLDDLRRAQDELIRRERLAVLADMAAAVAHEVRNPLGAMFNVIELLRRRRDRSAEEEKLQGILAEELGRLDVLVVNLVDLVRPLEAVLDPQRLVEVVDTALAQVLHMAPQAAKLRVSRTVEPRPIEVRMDSHLLELALVNVLRNAVQAMPDGGELDVDVRHEWREDRRWARIAIRDTGPGISPAVRAKIFDPFFTTRPTGSGLGLAIVKRVIAEHRGELEVHSESGKGTVFILRLPCEGQPSGAA